MPVIVGVGRALVRDYGGVGRQVLFVPSLVNPSDVLDLDEDRSLLRWLATQGVNPLLLDWGTPTPAEHDVDVAGHVETILLPLLDRLGEHTALAGYCLGGTMALAAATQAPVAGLALIATPWRFDRYDDAMRAALGALWRDVEPTARALGLLPMEVLQGGFWRLDPARTVAKYEALADRPADDPALARFVRLEDWANDGPPLTFAAARELLVDMFGQDVTGAGGWTVAGRKIDIAALDKPVLEIVSRGDRIVPAAAAAGIGTRLELALGHVGMIVGGGARTASWEPLAAWLRDLP